jgi:hypothetical protein
MFHRHRQSSGLIFTYKGQPISRPKTGWTAALRRAGLPHFRFHDLRHTFNSRLVEVGVIADIRRELMGHSRGGDVNSIYTHIDLPLLREAIHRLDQWYAVKVSSLNNGKVLLLPATINESPTELQVKPDDRNQQTSPTA